MRFRGDRIRVLEAPADSLEQDVWVFDATGRRVDGAPPPRRLRARSTGSAPRPREQLGRGRRRARLLARPVTTRVGATDPAVVVAGMDLTPYESAERRGLWLSLGLGLLTVVAAGAAAWPPPATRCARYGGWRTGPTSGASTTCRAASRWARRATS